MVTITVQKTIDTKREEIYLQKRKIRREVLERRDKLPQPLRAAASLLVTDRIIGHQWFYRADTILCFASFGSEINTDGILEEVLSKGKSLYLPRVVQLERESLPSMNFYQVTSTARLVKGYQGIREPDGRSEAFCFRPEEADRTLMLMPGVAFDSLRNRLGYGRGFYDRYLVSAADPGQWHTIALGFACQLVDEIPSCEGDIRPYQVILK